MNKLRVYRTDGHKCDLNVYIDRTRYSSFETTQLKPKVQEPKIQNSEVCKDNSCGVENLEPILDPRFNLRESAKDMILLEDHLTQPRRRCKDCIKKHALKIIAWLEEGKSLDSNHEYTNLFNTSLTNFVDAVTPFLVKLDSNGLEESDYTTLSQKIRVIRKPLCLKFASFN